MKIKFKYELGEKVFVIGRNGLCKIVGRGNMDFLSGGNLNIYCIDGAMVSNYTPEYILESVKERDDLIKKKFYLCGGGE